MNRHLRRKLTLRAHGEQVVLVKQKRERMAHVHMKAFLWALYLPRYPDLSIEVKVGDKYKPDVVQMDPRRGTPIFWGEAGHVSDTKIDALVRRYSDTHFAMAKWATSLDPFVDMVASALEGVDRGAPFDLFRFPEDASERFIDAKGRVGLSIASVPDGVEWVRLGADGTAGPRSDR